MFGNKILVIAALLMIIHNVHEFGDMMSIVRVDAVINIDVFTIFRYN